MLCFITLLASVMQVTFLSNTPLVSVEYQNQTPQEVVMLDEKAHKKLLAEANEAAEKAEELYRQHVNTLVNCDDERPQAQSYGRLNRAIERCRQLRGLLDDGSREAARLEKIIEDFYALDVPEQEEDRTLES